MSFDFQNADEFNGSEMIVVFQCRRTQARLAREGLGQVLPEAHRAVEDVL